MTTPALTPGILGSIDQRVAVPRYDRDAVSVGIVHFGVGGFHRAHQAVVIDDLLAMGHSDWGICGVGLMPSDARMRDMMREQGNLYTLTTRSANGEEVVRVVGSIVEYLFAPEEPDEVLRRLTDPATRIVSLTITEGGYLQDYATGGFDATAPAVLADLASPEQPTGAFGYIVEALRVREARGIPPFTVMSCDNIRSNGDIARRATVELARLRSPELAEWIARNVCFPNSMVDRITPATPDSERVTLQQEYGFADRWPVASEDFFQWVLEDSFSGGRPPFERAGVTVVNDVVPFELMKLRLLNASHQVLAFLGSLMGYRFVHDATGDPSLVALLRSFWRDEAIPTLAPIDGVDFTMYSESLLQRYSNPHVRDTLERLATDASNRIPGFVLPIVHDDITRGRPFGVGALTVAAWAQYVLGLDDLGQPLVQHDALADELRSRAAGDSREADGFLGIEAVFGKLSEHEPFVSAFERSQQLLSEGTARDAIAEVLAGPR